MNQNIETEIEIESDELGHDLADMNDGWGNQPKEAGGQNTPRIMRMTPPRVQHQQPTSSGRVESEDTEFSARQRIAYTRWGEVLDRAIARKAPRIPAAPPLEGSRGEIKPNPARNKVGFCR